MWDKYPEVSKALGMDDPKTRSQQRGAFWMDCESWQSWVTSITICLASSTAVRERRDGLRLHRSEAALEQARACRSQLCYFKVVEGASVVEPHDLEWIKEVAGAEARVLAEPDVWQGYLTNSHRHGGWLIPSTAKLDTAEKSKEWLVHVYVRPATDISRTPLAPSHLLGKWQVSISARHLGIIRGRPVDDDTAVYWFWEVRELSVLGGIEIVSARNNIPLLSRDTIAQLANTTPVSFAIGDEHGSVFWIEEFGTKSSVEEFDSSTHV
mmetsp:Transcript_12627/g.25423  ORF Transcript_12627/g.25423 Transcript_12627/m.25423 type:complete len:267 (-) Transcript_12627:1002-1802(-)